MTCENCNSSLGGKEPSPPRMAGTDSGNSLWDPSNISLSDFFIFPADDSGALPVPQKHLHAPEHPSFQRGSANSVVGEEWVPTLNNITTVQNQASTLPWPRSQGIEDISSSASVEPYDKPGSSHLALLPQTPPGTCPAFTSTPGTSGFLNQPGTVDSNPQNNTVPGDPSNQTTQSGTRGGAVKRKAMAGNGPEANQHDTSKRGRKNETRVPLYKQGPFNDPEKERKRLNAVKAKRARERTKKEMAEMNAEINRSRRETERVSAEKEAEINRWKRETEKMSAEMEALKARIWSAVAPPGQGGQQVFPAQPVPAAGGFEEEVGEEVEE